MTHNHIERSTARDCSYSIFRVGGFRVAGTRLLATFVLPMFLLAVIPLLAQAEPTTDTFSRRLTPMVRAVQKARPSVINIRGRKTVTSAADNTAPSASRREVNGMGTGIVIDERGYAITNYHVIEGVRRIHVTLDDQTQTTATLVAHDHATDLAIVKIDVDTSLPVITVGTSSDLMPAEPVAAVGNAYGYNSTVTQGIISQLGRTVQVSDDQIYQNLIQTDAAINPGNSGGPLLNIDGEMIGINVAVRVGAQSIGFAIPVDEAMEVAARLVKRERQQQVALGIQGETKIQDRNPTYVVQSVRTESPAAATGLQTGDIITAVGDQPVHRALDLERAVLGRKAGEQVLVKVSRGDETFQVNMLLGNARRKPSPTPRRWNALGVRLAPVPAEEFRRISARYRGGLRIVEVEPDGPAAKGGIRQGDVLVGMHLWETLSLEHVKYVLSRPEIADKPSFRFYVLRGSETLYGELQLATGATGAPNGGIASRPQ